MTEAASESPRMGLVYEDVIPVACHRLNAEPEAGERLRMETANDQVLRVGAALDEIPVEVVTDEPGIETDVQRLDFKVNVALDLVSFLVAQQVSLPKEVPVSLSAERVQWRSEHAMADEGDLVRIELYISAKYPRPLVLTGCVIKVAQSDAGISHEVNFLPLSDAVQDQLDKFIFRKHRRLIASTRRKQT